LALESTATSGTPSPLKSAVTIAVAPDGTDVGTATAVNGFTLK
jgi:hypothetical protein